MGKEQEIQPRQFKSNGHGELVLSSRDKQNFQNAVKQSAIPDIDLAGQILPHVTRYYQQLGVSPSDGKRIALELEKNLYGGTAEEQARASDGLMSIGQAMKLENIPPNGRKIR